MENKSDKSQSQKKELSPVEKEALDAALRGGLEKLPEAPQSQEERSSGPLERLDGLFASYTLAGALVREDKPIYCDSETCGEDGEECELCIEPVYVYPFMLHLNASYLVAGLAGAGLALLLVAISRAKKGA